MENERIKLIMDDFGFSRLEAINYIKEVEGVC